MRKLVMATTALLGLAFASPTFAQSSEAAPQPGLPSGAGFGAVNAQPPRATGDVVTTPTGSATRPIAQPAPRHYSYRLHRAHRAPRRARVTTPAQ